MDELIAVLNWELNGLSDKLRGTQIIRVGGTPGRWDAYRAIFFDMGGTLGYPARDD